MRGGACLVSQILKIVGMTGWAERCGGKGRIAPGGVNIHSSITPTVKGGGQQLPRDALSATMGRLGFGERKWRAATWFIYLLAAPRQGKDW